MKGDKVHRRKPPNRRILDMDSPISETYGRQEGSACNAHLGCTGYHPLFLLNQFGDLEGKGKRTYYFNPEK